VKRIFLFLTAGLFILSHLQAQTPNEVINSVNQRFGKVNDYKADVQVTCDIPSIKINPINAKVVYRQPGRFKLKSTGILILPKQNANFLFSTLRDTTAYTAVKTGEESLGGVRVQVISVIPARDTGDLILGKFWIDAAKGLVMKSQLTTRTQGTILIENKFGQQAVYALPDQMLFTIEAQKFKLPKALTMDIGTSSSKQESSSGDGKGRILLRFSNYQVNRGVTNSDFEDEAP
jgi:hypothetical protein